MPRSHRQEGRFRLEDQREQFRAIADRVRNLGEELDEAQLAWRAGPGRWSVAECVEHLSRTTEIYLPRLDAGIARTRQGGSVPGLAPGRSWVAGFLIRRTEPPPRPRIPSPERIRPDAPGGRDVASDPGAAIDRFLGLQERLLLRIDRASGLDADETRVRSPFLPLLRFTLPQAIALLVAHQRRHLWQIERILEDPDFPAD